MRALPGDVLRAVVALRPMSTVQGWATTVATLSVMAAAALTVACGGKQDEPQSPTTVHAPPSRPGAAPGQPPPGGQPPRQPAPAGHPRSEIRKRPDGSCVEYEHPECPPGMTCDPSIPKPVPCPPGL